MVDYETKIRALAEKLIRITDDLDDDQDEWERNIVARLQAMVLDLETEKEELLESA